MAASTVALALVLRREVVAGALSRLAWFAIVMAYAAAADLAASLLICRGDTLRVRGAPERPEPPARGPDDPQAAA